MTHSPLGALRPGIDTTAVCDQSLISGDVVQLLLRLPGPGLLGQPPPQVLQPGL